MNGRNFRKAEVNGRGPCWQWHPDPSRGDAGGDRMARSRIPVESTPPKRADQADLRVGEENGTYLADEGGGAAELGDGAGDVGGRAAGGLDEAARLGQRQAGHVGDEVDQHLAERHHQVVGRRRGNSSAVS